MRFQSKRMEQTIVDSARTLFYSIQVSLAQIIMLQLHETLWIGHRGDVWNLALLFEHDIQAVVDLAKNETPFPLPREMVHYRIPLDDDGSNSLTLLSLAIHSVIQLLNKKLRTLVCCSAGKSRSPAICAAALAQQENRTPQDCLESIQSLSPLDVSPGLWGQINERHSMQGESL